MSTPSLAVPQHAITLYGTPKYSAGFSHFDYVNPAAPKGGTLRLSSTGNFDSLNPYILKGVAAPGVSAYLFQSLMTPSYDEPQTYYPMIATSVDVAKDRTHADFTINPKAHWNDGVAITAQDVVFSFDVLKKEGHPVYRIMYKPISAVEALGTYKVRFHFDDTEHRELPLIAAGMPILPKHYYEKVAFNKTTLLPPLGSGPYRITNVEAGRSITFERVKDYWAKNLPTQRGLYNFDTIRFDIYRDDVVALEGIKSGQFDYYEEYIARNWATAYNIDAVKRGDLLKLRIPNKIPRGMQAFLFNTRRDKFSDPRVREAIGLTMDYEWMNKTLFYSAYDRSSSFFQNTEFQATGLPEGAELALLEPHKKELPPALFKRPFTVPKTDGSGYDRGNLIKAQSLLDDAGWVLRDGKRINAKTGEPLTIEFLMTQRTFERVVSIMRKNLLRLGIDSTFRYVDASQYQRRIDHRDFDMVSIWWNLGLFYPSTEQYTYWHSSQAELEGSQNLGGIKNPVIDELVGKILRAQTLETLRPAARALDRVLLWNHYVIPHWYLSAWRQVHWNKFGKPTIQPSYNAAIDTWWMLPASQIKAGVR
ncbi:MAG: extracellular solute-binding protein [Rickettsiales bacterium]